CSAQEQTLFQVKDSHESAMHVTEDTIPRRLEATNKMCLHSIIATLVALLVFALATIMVLVIQRTLTVPHTTQTALEQLFNLGFFFPAGNTSEDYLRILHSVPFNTAIAYMRVSNPVKSSKLSLIEKGICEDIQCKSDELVIEKQGLYLIYCHLNFYFANCSNNPTDLKIELLVNDKINRQTLSTWCASDTCREKSFKTLFLLHLTRLNTKDRISVRLNQPEFLNVIFLPNENVLGVLRYSDKM
ncbi:TNFL8 factor, partial [Eudromia elegans]|nr:TNFL8 factor [Eudromia elegans]